MTDFGPCRYSAESFIISDLRHPHLRAELASLKSTVTFLVERQNADGSWGEWSNVSTADGVDPDAMMVSFSPSGDAQRSPRAASLLQWYV